MPRKTASAWGLAVLLYGLHVAFLGACDRTDHSRIEEWQGTVKGPEKLAKALENAKLDTDLRAHAALALVALGNVSEVKRILVGLPPQGRAAILANLIRRLWDACRVEDAFAQPTPKQVEAKDALFSLRDVAEDSVQDEIDAYLVDWLTGNYERRALLGTRRGDAIVGVLGSRAAPRLLAAAAAIVSDPGDAKTIPILGNELLKGLAYSGDAEALGFLLDLTEKDHADGTLRVRAMGAIYQVFVADTAHPRTSPSPLVPHLGVLAGIASSQSQPGENVNVAFEIIAAAGAPDCIAPLASLARSRDQNRRWRAVDYGIRCGGAAGVIAMAEALPEGENYSRGILGKYFFDKAVAVGPDVVTAGRTLLGSSSWIGRLTGIEVLSRAGSRADASLVRKLENDRTSLKGLGGSIGASAKTCANRLENER